MLIFVLTQVTGRDYFSFRGDACGDDDGGDGGSFDDLTSQKVTLTPDDGDENTNEEAVQVTFLNVLP